MEVESVCGCVKEKETQKSTSFFQIRAGLSTWATSSATTYRPNLEALAVVWENRLNLKYSDRNHKNQEAAILCYSITVLQQEVWPVAAYLSYEGCNKEKSAKKKQKWEQRKFFLLKLK
ncbi:uncharacterized protein RHO17_012367 isoform 1-T1 [Thomomys bottae]